MKKALINYLIFLPFIKEYFFRNKQNTPTFFNGKFKLALVLSFICTSLWAQPPHIFTADGTVVIPAGITSMDIKAWGAGGAGGGAGNSPLLSGRSGAGGGGGAYANGLITVNPLSGVPLNIKVAGAVTGTTATGTAGGSSTIQSFETVILAVGGGGGTANTAGGTPSGGAGGLASASIGSISTASGITGGNGNAALLSLGLSSGAGGNAGGTGGGLGGAALSTLLLGNGPGNAGSPPGGGGSGGLQTVGNPSQVGGSGAHGQVIVTYTCPTYNITGISATNVCISPGTSSVTVTSSAASLPIGIYTVTYNRGTPAATGLTAAMTVTTAGTGTFTAVGLTTTGTSSIAVTALTSGVCISPISGITTNVTISPLTVAGSVGGGTTICNGATSAGLLLTGNVGSVLRWEYSTTPFSTWTPTSVANTTTTYTSGALTETTQFRAVVQSVACNTLNSTPTTVTVNPLPQGSLSANGPFCATGAGQLTFTATSGTGPYTVVYNDGVANRTANSVVSGTAFATFTTPVLSTTTYTLVSVTDANTCVRSSGFTTSSATITVNPLPQGSLSANGPFCATGAGQLTFTATSGTGPYTVVYNDGVSNRTVNSVVSGTAFATAVTPVIATTTYTLVSVTDANTCIRSSAFTTGSATITVNPLPQGSLTANGPFCATGAGQLTFTATSGTGPYTVVYNDGVSNRTVNSVVSGTAFATFTTPVISTTTYTLVSVTDANTCVRSSGFTTGSATITVNPLPQGSLSANGPFCATGAGQLTFTATSGTGPYTVVYNDGVANRTANSVVSGTAFATAVTPVISTTTYTLVSVTDANTCIRSSGFTGGGSATITVRPLPQGSLSANGPFCATGAGQLTFTATSGTGPFTVVYNDGVANRTANSVVSGTAFATFTTPVISTTTYTLVSVTDANTCVRSSGFTTSSATITVNPLPQGSLSANGPFCATGAGQLTFTATSGTGPYTVVYNDGVSNRTANSVISGTAFATAVTPVISTTTYTLVSVTDANTCIRNSGFTGSPATITVNPLPQGSLSANGPFCATGAGQLTFTATSGTGPYTVVYNDGVANRTANSVVSGTAFATFTTSVLSTTTYTLVSVTDANTCVRSSGFTTSSATITVNPLPQGSLSANGPFCATGAGQLTFTATSGTGPYTIVYNDGVANRTANSVVSGTSFATAVTPVIATTTYSLVSVTDANTCIRSSAFTTGSATITVNPLPQGSLSANGPFCATGAGQLTFTATSGTGPYTVVYNDGVSNRTANSVVSGTAFATFTTPVISTTTYTLVSVTDANTCVRSSGFTTSSATITVNPLPQGSLSANGPFCATGAGQLTFTATSGTGPFTVVYNDGVSNRTANSVVSGTAFATFTTPVLSTTTYTLVSVTDANTCVRSSGFTTDSATITVRPLPQGSLSANGPFCATGAGQLTFTATSGTGPYTVVYNDGVSNRTANSVVSGTAFATAVTPVLNTTTYTLVSVTDANTCIRSSGFTTSSATITVNPLPQGSLSANGPFCATGAGQLTFTATSGTGPYTVVYNDGVSNRTANSVVSGTAFATAVTPVLNTTTYTLVSVTDANTCIRSSGFTTSSATITVNPLPQGSLSANGPFCATGAGQLTFTATSGTGPFTVIYNDGVSNRTANSVISGTAFATAVTPVISTTTYTLVSVTDANTCIRNSGFTGSSATITVNPLPQGSLSANGPFCVSGAGQLTFTATSGTGPFTVVYNDGVANRTANSVVSGTAFATFQTPVSNTTTYTLVSVTDANTCIRSSAFTGSSATITVNPLPVPVFSVQPGATVCVDDSVTYTTLAGQTNYLWTVPGVAGTDYNITAGGISTTNNTVSLQWKTTGNKTVTVSYSSNGCAAVVNASNSTNVIKTQPGIVNGGTHVCSGNPSPLLTLSGYNGTIVRWEYAESLPYVWQSISHTGVTYQPGILSTSTSYRAVIKNGTCAEDFSIETRIDIDTRPSTPVPGTIVQPTCVNPTGSVVLNGLITGPNVVINQTGTSLQTYTDFGASYTVSNLSPGTYYFTIQDGANCPSLPTEGIVIIPPVTNIWNGSVWSKGLPPIITDIVEFAGNYQTTGNLSACSCIVHPGVSVTVKSNHTLTIQNFLDNNGGILTFENNASLLQVNNSANTGNIFYKRDTPPVRRYDFTYWSSPVTRSPAFTLHDLSPNTLIDKYEGYNPLTGWIIYNNGTEPMAAGAGYTVRAPQNHDLVTPNIYHATFEGVPNNGPYNISLGAAEKWSLLGNPYPSAIYADQFIFDNAANIYGTLYFWTHNSSPNSTTYAYAAEDYAIYNLSGSIVIGGMTGTGAGTPGNQNPPLGYIAAGQSFFVKSKTGQNAVFTNSMRVAGNNTQFFKNANTKLEKHRVWLNLTNTQGAFKQLLVGYIEGATDGWDTNYDGITADANKFLDFYSINGDLKLVIQGRALPFNDSDIVPLGYRSAIAGEFTIAIDHADGHLSAQPIFIEDKTLGIIRDLRESNYTFTTTTGVFADRFVLRYKKTLGVEDFDKNEDNVIAFVKNKSIKVSSLKDAINEVFIYDVSGKMLYEKKKIGNTELQITNLQSGNQVLFVKVILENGYISTKKVVF
ncbi:T9SS sorting signal type C domain-containing protein [uncultured Flavobacterium sp.]|uniref:T9SS sorting signal type C domain-containing protein n=1 Tax=uncultured Flavobacterium sp. TaxID=165435 RepID=UPI003081ABB1